MNDSQRYEELVHSTTDENVDCTQDELDERVQLFYELNTQEQFWRDENPELTPQDIWGK